MKKILPLFIGLSLVTAGLASNFTFGNSRPAKADGSSIITENIDLTFLNLVNNGKKYVTSSSTGITYAVYADKGASHVDRTFGDERTERMNCFYMKRGTFDPSPYGIISQNIVGYVNKITIEFGNYSIINSTPGTIDVYGSNSYDYYGNPQSSSNALYLEEERGIKSGDYIDTISLTNTTVELNGAYRYFGLVPSSNSSEIFIKSITAEWEVPESVYMDLPQRIDSTSGLKEGDVVAFVNEENGKVLSDVYDGSFVDCTIDEQTHELTSFDGAEFYYVTGNEVDGFKFSATETSVLSFAYSDDPEEWTGIDNTSEADTWNVSITNGVATVQNSDYPDYKLGYDSSDPPMFDVLDYDDGAIAIYKINNTGSTEQFELCDDDNEGVSPSYNFAKQFLSEMKKICDLNGQTNVDTLKAKWNYLFSVENDAYAKLTAISRLIFQNTEANSEGHSIQRAMALYEYIIERYGFNESLNYLHRDVSSNSNVTKNVLSSSTNTIFVMAISLSCFTIFGAAFCLRKKKFER